GPSWGMLEAGKKGLLPAKLSATNAEGVPVNFLLLQGAIVSIWAAVLTFGGGGANVSFFTAISLTVVIYVVGYIIFFLAYMKVVLSYSNLPRAFEIPGGKGVKMFVAISGLVISIVALAISFIPPAQVGGGAAATEYMTILVVSFAITLVLPFWIYHVMRKNNPLPPGVKMLDDNETSS
ncbi:glutamate:gamma-aminobutyrate antiporter, partial [Shewanella sp. 0m-11]